METQPARHAFAIATNVLLAGVLGMALIGSARMFSRSAQSLRHAVQGAKSAASLTNRLQSAAKDPESSKERNRILNQFEGLRNRFDIQKVKQQLFNPQPATLDKPAADPQ